GAGQDGGGQPQYRDADLPSRQEQGADGSVPEPGHVSLHSRLRLLRREHERGGALPRASARPDRGDREEDAGDPSRPPRRALSGLAGRSGEGDPRPPQGLGPSSGAAPQPPSNQETIS